MGDQNTILNEAEVRHVLKRTIFGPSAKDWKKARNLPGLTRGDAADYVLGLKRKTLKLKGNGLEDLHNSWVKHLTKGKTPFLDKLVLFWHDHFSVAASAVNNTDATVQHMRNHYDLALGNFKDYVKAINKDPAMMIFLNTLQNNKDIPNENYGRELCELFTLGVFDLNGVANYLQDDIVQISRAFTGWRLDDGVAYLRASQHDTEAEFPARGPKALFDNAHGFGVGGASFTTGGEGENEIDEVIDILFAHLDSDGENTVARRTAFRLLEFFAYAAPDKTIVDEVLTASNFATTWDIQALVRAIFVHDVFFETMAEPPFSAATKKSVKWPIDYAISTLRIIKMKPKKRWLVIPGGSWSTMFTHLSNMGQIIGDPPSVFGWNWEAGWISSSTLLARYTFARDIVAAREGGRFRPDKLIDTDLTDPNEIADAVLAALGVAGQFTTAEHDELIDYLTDNGVNLSLDLDDDDTRNIKLHGVFAMVMQSPAYQLH
jgi:uncharacterized protein (DUF1800 family)